MAVPERKALKDMQSQIASDLNSLVEFESMMGSEDGGLDGDVATEVQRNLDNIMALGTKIRDFTKAGANQGAGAAICLGDVQTELRASVQRIEAIMEGMTSSLHAGEEGRLKDPGTHSPVSLPVPTPAAENEAQGKLLVTVVECQGLSLTQRATGHTECYAVVEVSPAVSKRTSVTRNSAGLAPRWNDGGGDLLFNIESSETTGKVIVTLMQGDGTERRTTSTNEVFIG